MKPPAKILLLSLAGLTCGYFGRQWAGFEKASVPRGTALHGAASAGGTANADSAATLIKLRERALTLPRGAEGNIEEWLHDLVPLLRANPRRTMAFIFHELPPEVSLKLLPLLGSELARMDDTVIRDALSSVRTAKEMKVAWAGVLAARFGDSAKSAVKLARIAPAGSEALVQLVTVAAGGGVADLMRLADAGAEKSWFVSPYVAEPKWLKSAAVANSMELLNALKSKFAGTWTDQDTFLFAAYAPSAATDKQVLFSEIAKGPLLTASPKWSQYFVFKCVRDSPENLKLLFDSLPEGFQRRKLAGDAMTAVRSFDDRAAAAVRESLPPSESVSATRKPLLRTVEDKIMIGSHGGGRHQAYAFSATADPVDQPYLIKHAIDFTKSAFGTPGVLRSLPDADDSGLTTTVYAEAARLIIKERAGGFSADDTKALQSLTSGQLTKLRSALIQGGADSLASQIVHGQGG